MKKNYIIGGALIVGGGLYYAYTKGLLDKFIKPKENANEENQSAIDAISAQQEAARIAAANAARIAAAARQASSLDNPNSYAGKVAYIQGQINVSVDGDAGTINSNTNKAFDSIYGLDKGAISTSNIDYYKTRVQNKNTKAAIALAAQQKTAANNKSVTNVNSFLDLVNKKGMTATLLRDLVVKTMQYNQLTKSFVDMNIPRTFKKGTSFGGFLKPNEIAGPYGINVAYIERISLLNPNLNYYFINPSDFLLQK